MKAVVKDLANMHKQLQPLLTRAQLHAVFHQILSAFDGGLLEAYSAVDTGPLFSRQCIVQDVHYLRQEVAKLHLNLPTLLHGISNMWSNRCIYWKNWCSIRDFWTTVL